MERQLNDDITIIIINPLIIQTLRAFRRPQLDSWMLGCLDALRIGERIGTD